MKKRVAFIKYCGASAGGTEKYLQTIAANLDKSKFDVDYYFSGPAELIGSDYKHPFPNEQRLEYLNENGVNLIKFNVEKIDYSEPENIHWINTNFWDKFNEENYDLIQSARSGKNEDPFSQIKNTPIIDSVHIFWGIYDQENIFKIFMHSKDIKNKWIEHGGNDKKIVLGLNPIDEKKENIKNLRKQFNLENKFIFGMHQREADLIYSDVPLNCYSKIENKNTAFLIMGGSKKYQEQAKALNLMNFHHINFDFEKNSEEIFLNTLDVFTHGRKDGETFGLAIAEAMRNSLPIVSHKNVYNNGHVETVENAGKVVGSHRMYVLELLKLMRIKRYYSYRMKNSKRLYIEKFSSNKVIKKIENIYLQAIL